MLIIGKRPAGSTAPLRIPGASGGGRRRVPGTICVARRARLPTHLRSDPAEDPVSQPSLTLDVSSRKRQVAAVIQSFAGDTTRQIWEGIPVRRIPAELQLQARKRLSYLNAATRIEDLYIPPSNHFHAVGKRYAIRVNRQWRITFNWSDSGPSEVLFEDYH